MLTEWGRAVSFSRRVGKKIEKTVARIEGGSYDRKPAQSLGKKSPKKRKAAIQDDGYSGGTPGTATGSSDRTQDGAVGQ